jgi:hypothetical protein
MIREGAWANPTLRQRFLAEARAAAQLRHPHIVTVHEVGEYDGSPFFSMELIEGPHLGEFVAGRPLAGGAAAELLMSVAEAIHFAHSQGILHRDLKPQNILLDRSGRPHVTDFGLAYHLGQETGLTLTGQLLGSPAFMSPEQVSGQHRLLAPTSDVYSLGGLLYYLLTARAPFEGPSLSDILSRVRDEEPIAPTQINNLVPPDLETICLKCLQKEPSDRYPTAEELAADLGRVLRNEVIRARPMSPPVRAWRWCRRRPALAALGAIAGTALIAALVGGVTAWRRAAQVREIEAQSHAGRAERLLVEARHVRESGRLGQQSLALSLVREARELSDRPEFLARLRDEAIACLVIPDVSYESFEWSGMTNLGVARPGTLAFSRDLRVYALREGTSVIVRQASNGVELGRVMNPFGPPAPANQATSEFRIRDVSTSGRWLALEDGINARGALWDLKQNPAKQVAAMSERCAGFAGFLKEKDEQFPSFAGIDGSLGVFDLETGDRHELGILTWALRKATSWSPFWRVRQLRVGTDGRLGVVSIRDSTAGERPLLALFDLPADMLMRRFETESHAQDLALNASGDLIIAVAAERRTDVLDALSGRPLITLTDPCLQPGVGPTDRSLGLFWRSNRVVEARLQGSRLCREWRHTWEAMNYHYADGFTAGGTEALTFSADGRVLAAVYPPRIGFWDLVANQPVGWKPCDKGARAYFHPKQPTLFLVGTQQIARLNLVPQSSPSVLRLETSGTGISGNALGEAAFDASGTVIAVAQPLRNRVVLLDGGDLKFRRSIGPQTNVFRLALSASGRWLATAARGDRELQIWDAESGTLIRRLPAPEYASFALSPDDRWLAREADQAYEIQEIRQGHVVARVPMRLGQNIKRRALAFSPDGRWLAVLLGESDAGLVDARNWQVVATLPAPTPSSFNTLAFSGDGSLLAAGGEGGRVCVWDLPGLNAALTTIRLGWEESLATRTSALPASNAPPRLIHHADFPLPMFPISYPTNASGLSLPGDYNFRRDFSITQNPAGVWSYGWKSDLTGRFQLFRIPRRDLRDIEGRGDYQNFCWCEEVGREPWLIYQPSPQTWVYTARDPKTGKDRTWNLSPALAYLGPTDGEHYRENAWTGVRFTAPQSDSYEFGVGVHSLPQFERFQKITRTEFAVLHHASPVDKHILAPSEQVDLTYTLVLATGDVVEFLCHTPPREKAAPGYIALNIEVNRR